MSRRILLVAHAGRAEARAAVTETARLLRESAVEPIAEDREVAALVDPPLPVPAGPDEIAGCELVVVLGGDGTILRGAEMARLGRVPLLGVNLGHIGFLAEAERDAVSETVARVVAQEYSVEERMTLDVTARLGEQVLVSDWALNEASLEKPARQKMVDLVVEVDGRPLSRWRADGVILATPTGSTAYAFSAGGPVVWPEVEALLLVPLSAHALFARPLVVSPRSVLAVELTSTPGSLWCDGRRTTELPPGARVEVRRGSDAVRLARLHRAPFTDRLVAKFALPVEGWRGR